MNFKTKTELAAAIQELKVKFPAKSELDLENALDNSESVDAAAAWTQRFIDFAAMPVPASNSRSRGKKELTYTEQLALFSFLNFTFSQNELTDDIFLNAQHISDSDMKKIQSQLRDVCGIEKAKYEPEVLDRAITRAALDNTFNPIKDFFRSLPPWDGENHLEKLASHFKSPQTTVCRWLEVFMTGAVRKVYEHKHGPTLVLHGPQRIGKSYFCRELCSPLPEFFIEESIRPDDKDCRIRACSGFIWEIGEAGRALKRDPEEIKFFLSCEQVRARKPYGHVDLIKPVMASFICTLNNSGGIFSDETGNRRFLSLSLTGIDRAYSKTTDWIQLWAQAQYLYTKDRWQLTEYEQLIQEQENTGELVENPASVFLGETYQSTTDPNDRIPVGAVLDYLVRKGLPATRNTQMAIAAFMRDEKIDKIKKREDTGRNWYWSKIKLTEKSA